MREIIRNGMDESVKAREFYDNKIADLEKKIKKLKAEKKELQAELAHYQSMFEAETGIGDSR